MSASWGTLEKRYAGDRPRRMLALDGGGIRGIITLGVLKSLEKKLADRYEKDLKDFRLSQFFDYVGGTSTGAIIAAAIARGLSVKEIQDFYLTYGGDIFTKRVWGIWDSLYKNGPLEQQLKTVYGANTTLEDGHLKSLLLVVMRNATTDSAWPISSNPFARYNALDRDDCNLRAPLWKLVRASTAAPVYFVPEVISLDKNNDPKKTFAFVDGGTTSYNNPAFLMTRMATESCYGLGWKRGERQLLVVSVGTGEHPELGVTPQDPSTNVAAAAKNTLLALMTQAAYDQDVNCRTVGRCTFGDVLDREVGDLIPRDARGNEIPLSQDLGRAFLYVRYNCALDRDWLDKHGLGKVDEVVVRKLDAVEAMDQLTAVGEALGEKVSLDHLGSFVSVPL